MAGCKDTICSACYERNQRKQYNPKIIRMEQHPLKVGSTTLVSTFSWPEIIGPCVKCGYDHNEDPHWRGRKPICLVNDCGGEIPVKDIFPMKHGNCCDVLNMCTENVREALKRWPRLSENCLVEIVELHGRERVRVIDNRLPEDWKKNCCRTCSIYEDDCPPEPYPSEDNKPLTGYIFSPYIPVLGAPPEFDISQYIVKDKPRKLNITWPLDTVDKIKLENL